MKKNLLVTLICLLISAALTAQENGHATSREIKDNEIVYPESMTEKLSDLLHNWQLDLSKANVDCKRGENVTFHDTVFIKRLYQLPTVMEVSFNSVVKNYIEMYAIRKREQVAYMLALGGYYFPMFEQALDRHGLPLELKYLPVIESALNPVAVSRAGATGLWQFMLRTGKGYGLEVNSLVDERRDPYKATEAAVQYLKDLYAIYGDWNLVIAAYNCGPGSVNKAIARSGGKHDYWEIYYLLPRETRGYVPAFIAANYIMNYYADHNICPVHLSGANTALDTIQVNERIHFEQIAGVLDLPVSELRRLNPQFKKDIIPGNFKPYALVLPTEKMYSYIDKNDSIVNFERGRFLTHRVNTENYLNGSVSSGSGNTANIYYRVKKGDNLSAIAGRNGITLAQLKSWNGLKSDRLSIGKQLIVGKRAEEISKTENAEQVSTEASEASAGVTRTENLYYRVRKGDTLGKIARRNGVKVSQIQSWNGLSSTRIGIGDQLIVGKKVASVPEVKPEVGKQEYSRAEDSGEGSSVISNYLKDQIGKKDSSLSADNLVKGSDENGEAEQVVNDDEDRINQLMERVAEEGQEEAPEEGEKATTTK